MKISIYNEQAKQNRNGFAPLIFKLWYDGKMRKLSTGLKCHVEAWKHDAQKATVRGGMGKAEVEQLNSEIIKRLNYVNEIVSNNEIKPTFEGIKRDFKAMVAGQPKTAGARAVSSRETKDLSFRISDFIDWYQKRLAKTKSKETVRKFNAVKMHLTEFSGDITLDQIDFNYMTDLAAHMVEHYKANNTIQTITKKTKELVKMAGRRGCKINDTCFDFTYKGQRATPIYLTWEEVEKLTKFKSFAEPGDEAIRDSFLFRCYTGIRKSDEQNIKKHNFLKMGNNYFIRFDIVKSDKLHEIALNKRALAIAKKYKFELPRVSMTDENDRIKKIARAAKINSITEKTIYSGVTRKADKREKWNFISTHTARRTFARRWADAGGSIVELCKYLGQSSTEITLLYIGYNNQEVNKSMLALFD